MSNAVNYSIGGSVEIYVSLAEQTKDGTSTNEKTKEYKKERFINDRQSINGKVSSYDFEIGHSRHFNILPTHILIEMEDSGSGLSVEAKSKLFQPFNQDIHQRGWNSTGPGLFSLARRLVALGGKYRVVNRKDNLNGCRFWFSFPYEPDKSIPSLNIETEIINSINLGCIVDTATNGQKGLEMSIKQFECNLSYNVVLTDIHMPIMDSFQYAKTFRMIENKYNDEYPQ